MSLINFKDNDVDRWTLREVLERGALGFECKNCWKFSQPDVSALVEKVGADAQVQTVRQRTVCRTCGARNARALVLLRGVRGSKAWVPVPPRGGR